MSRWSSAEETTRRCQSLNILDYAWNTATSIAQRDYDSFRLILDDSLTSPILSGDTKGFVVKLPTPKVVQEKFYLLHGLYFDQDEKGWDTIWRSFRASLFHSSLHAAYSDFRGYATWAKGLDVTSATFAVSLIEDIHILAEAKKQWPGVLSDLAYAGYLSALRLPDPNDIDGDALRVATKLLLSSAGVFSPSDDRLAREEDRSVLDLSERIFAKAEKAAQLQAQERRVQLCDAAEDVVRLVDDQGSLREIPYFPHTEAHGPCDLFEGKLVERAESGDALLSSALAKVGLKEDTGATEPTFVSEAREVLASMESVNARLAKAYEYYGGLIGATRLGSVEFPRGDFGTFKRVRSELAGPIKNVRDQLMQVRNVLDDETGHQAGATLDTQAALQVLATGTARSDVFEQLQPSQRDEAWSILIDASKSTSNIAYETKGIATCLAEIVAKLVSNANQWSMLAFNDSIQIIKDFNEGYGINVKARIGGLSQRNTTLLPDAIQVAFKALSAKEATARILVVVSDGYPSGYNGIDQKLVSVIKDVSKSSVYMMGVGVDSAAIKKLFPLNCVMKTPYEMMKTFAKSYFELASTF